MRCDLISENLDNSGRPLMCLVYYSYYWLSLLLNQSLNSLHTCFAAFTAYNFCLNLYQIPSWAIGPQDPACPHPYPIPTFPHTYTQSQKKRTVESCVSFAEECRQINFVVCFILPMLSMTICKKPYSKIVHGSVMILERLSTCETTKIHPLRKLESCISFF